MLYTPYRPATATVKRPPPAQDRELLDLITDLEFAQGVIEDTRIRDKDKRARLRGCASTINDAIRYLHDIRLQRHAA